MPFVSKVQSRAAFGGYLGAEMKKKAEEYAGKTDYGSLPERKKKKKPVDMVGSYMKGR